jgi:class 3 adenylate cyclase
MSTRFEATELVFAIVSVAGATAACATHGDAATVETLATYYSLIADGVRRSGGRVIKVIGDGVIVAFPVSHAREAVTDLRSLQEGGTNVWRLFDERCYLQVKVGIGSLISGSFGPPGQERDDLYGDALNQLFKLAGGDFVISPALTRVIGGE